MTSGKGPNWADETHDLYVSRGITGIVGAGARPAILVIDMTRAFTDTSHPVGSEQDDSVGAIAKLLSISRTKRVPTFFTSISYLEDGSDTGVWGKKMPALLSLARSDERAIEVDQRIAPAHGEIFLNKRAPSAFFGTGLDALLTPSQIDTLIVTGCATSGCVRATVVDGVSYGYRVIVPEECVADRAPGPHEASLFDINAKYGDVMPLESVIAYLKGIDVYGEGTIGGKK